MDRTWLNLGPTLLFLGLMSAEGHLKLALAVPGNHSVGPCDPVTAPYGRRGHGRLRCRPTVRPAAGKGLRKFFPRRAAAITAHKYTNQFVSGSEMRAAFSLLL